MWLWESHVVHGLDTLESSLLKKGIKVIWPVVCWYNNFPTYKLGIVHLGWWLHHSDNIVKTAHPFASKSSLPKHQSGENLVCPTIKNDTVMLSLRPTIPLHARYCITYRFLFWPEQLSAWRVTSDSPRLWCSKKWCSMLFMLLAALPVLTASSIR